MSPRGSAARTGELCCAAQGGDCCPATTTCCGTDCCWPGEECCLAADECCAVGYTCCGGVECCAVDFCCGNGECCTQECEECLENGSLSGGSIDVQPNPACIGDTITFTASGVVDDGGIKRVYCTAKEAIPPVAPPYTWQLTIPPDYPPPLPPLSGTGPAVSVVAEAAGTYSATFTATADRECEPPEITVGPATATVTEIPITAEVIDQDDPTNAMWTGLGKGSPVYGGSEASTADNVRLEVIPPPGAVSNIVWTVEGPGGGTYSPPPSGPQATQWDLGDILNPEPGEIAFSVEITYADGSRKCGEFNAEIGVRTDDVIVIGWIDAAGVPLSPAGVATYWTTELPLAGPPVPSSSTCNWIVAELSVCDITPNGQSLAVQANRDYILLWLFKYADNTDPSQVIPGGDFLDTNGMHVDESEVTAFKSTLTNFKLFSRYQVKYTNPDWCTTQPTVLKASSLIGTTENPCGPSTIPPANAQYPGQVGPYNQPPTVLCTTTPRAVVINDGSPDSGAVSAFHTLMGQSPPVGASLFWESIGSQIKYWPNGSTAPEIIVQPYPTYYVYHNGRRVTTIPAAPTPADHFYTNPYPFGTVPCETLFGTTPGGRCGFATMPPDATARWPDYVIP